MVALWYILNTARGMRKLWCLKSDSDISSTSFCDFSWNLAKALALPHVQQRSLNGLVSSMQLKIKMFLGIVLKVDEPVVDEPSSLYRKQRKDSQELDKGDVNYTWPITTQKDNAPKSTEQCQS